MSSLLPLMLDIRHWLDDSGQPVPQIRRRVLHFARLIEYGGPLTSKQMRETLIECPRRPGRVRCPGLLCRQDARGHHRGVLPGLRA